jgi:hypothetical protein
MFNQTAVREWAQETAECIPANGLDGVLLDQEAIDLDFNQTGKQSLKTNCLTLLIWIVQIRSKTRPNLELIHADWPGWRHIMQAIRVRM